MNEAQAIGCEALAIMQAKLEQEIVKHNTSKDEYHEAKAKLEQAQADAARLDWLDKYAHIASWVDNEPIKMVIDAASGKEFTGDTWREAIDAAMKEQE
jgi:hypothetical protein